MGNPTKWGFSVCYFRRGFATPLKVGKNRGTPQSGALVRGQKGGACRKDGLCSSAKSKIRVRDGIYLYNFSINYDCL